MSDQRQAPFVDAERQDRRRGLLGLAALAVVAVLVVVVMVAFLRAPSGGTPSAGPSVQFQQASTAAPVAPPATTAKPPSAAPSSSPSPSPSPSGPPCTGNPCAVTGDAGNSIAAVNAYRSAHGVNPVPGTATAGAAQCALSEGDGPACAPHWAYESVPAQDGAAAVNALAARDSGWLTDSRMTSFSVGWVYVPAGNQWRWAVLKTD